MSPTPALSRSRASSKLFLTSLGFLLLGLGCLGGSPDQENMVYAQEEPVFVQAQPRMAADTGTPEPRAERVLLVEEEAPLDMATIRFSKSVDPPEVGEAPEQEDSAAPEAEEEPVEEEADLVAEPEPEQGENEGDADVVPADGVTQSDSEASFTEGPPAAPHLGAKKRGPTLRADVPVVKMVTEQQERIEQQEEAVDDMHDDLDEIVRLLEAQHPELQQVQAQPVQIAVPEDLNAEEQQIYVEAVQEQVQVQEQVEVIIIEGPPATRD